MTTMSAVMGRDRRGATGQGMASGVTSPARASLAIAAARRI